MPLSQKADMGCVRTIDPYVQVMDRFSRGLVVPQNHQHVKDQEGSAAGGFLVLNEPPGTASEFRSDDAVRAGSPAQSDPSIRYPVKPRLSWQGQRPLELSARLRDNALSAITLSPASSLLEETIDRAAKRNAPGQRRPDDA